MLVSASAPFERLHWIDKNDKFQYFAFIGFQKSSFRFVHILELYFTIENTCDECVHNVLSFKE